MKMMTMIRNKLRQTIKNPLINTTIKPVSGKSYINANGNNELLFIGNLVNNLLNIFNGLETIVIV